MSDKTRQERVHRDGRRILDAMNDTPLEAMDAAFYQHYAEELRLVVEDLLDLNAPTPSVAPARVWLLWNCDDLTGAYMSPHAAYEARADFQRHLICTYGPDPALLESISISTAILENTVPTKPGGLR